MAQPQPSSTSAPQAASAASAQPTPNPPASQNAPASVCDFFLRGVCRFGSRCRLLHPAPAPAEPAAKDSPSLLRLRPAQDVIGRLQWDTEVMTAERLQRTTVGYLDRFEGMQEEAFTAFNWQTDIADADFRRERPRSTHGPWHADSDAHDDTQAQTGLAIPRHRIWYFKYRGQLLWDRRSRVDHVFGLPKLADFVAQCDAAAEASDELAETEPQPVAEPQPTAELQPTETAEAAAQHLPDCAVYTLTVPVTIATADLVTEVQGAAEASLPQLAAHRVPRAGR